METKIVPLRRTMKTETDDNATTEVRMLRFWLRISDPVFIRPLETMLQAQGCVIMDRSPGEYLLLIPEPRIERVRTMLRYHYTDRVQLVPNPQVMPLLVRSLGTVKAKTIP